MSETATAVEQPVVQAPPTPQPSPVVEQSDAFSDRFLSGADLMEKMSPRPAPQKPAQQPAQQPAPQQSQPAAEQKPVQPEAQAAPAEPEPVLDDRTKALQALGGIFTGQAQPKPTEIPDPVKQWAEAQGYTPDDILGIDTLRQQVKQGEEYKDRAEKLQTLLEALPADFRIAIDRAVRGENWREPLLSSHDDVDFSRDFSKQDAAAMLQKFAPGKVDAETLQAAKDGDENAKRVVELATDIARTKYDQIRAQQEGHFKMRQEQDQIRAQQYEQSLNASIRELQRLDPRVGALVPEIRQGLTPEGINGLFFDEKGMLRPDAARIYAVAKYQSELFDSKVKQVAKEAKDKAELDVLNRTPERPTTPSRTEVRNTPAPDGKKLADAQMDAWLQGADILGKR